LQGIPIGTRLTGPASTFLDKASFVPHPSLEIASMRHVIILCLCMFVSSRFAAAQQPSSDSTADMPGAQVDIYKTIGDTHLKMYMYFPPAAKSGEMRPAIVFFFGGGWQSGSPEQFRPHCDYLAKRGMVAMAAEYRVQSRHKALIVDCVADAKAAIRWVRTEATRLGIDRHKIVAAGGSAGGHLAACTGTVPGFEGDADLTVSSIPNALVLFNPVLALAPIDGQMPIDVKRIRELQRRSRGNPQAISPYHHIQPGAPPTIIFHGTADQIVPYWTVEQFAEKMKAQKNRCDLIGFEGKEHGFFNFGRSDGFCYRETVQAMDRFLVSLEFLKAAATSSAYQ
jgi:acetyl esterase